LIIVVADHGSSFRPDDFRRQVSETNFADIMAVPLLIKRPFQKEGGVDDSPVEVIDILPSIADVLDTELPWPVDGRSVFDKTAPRREHKICYNARNRMEFEASSFEHEYHSSLKYLLTNFGSGKSTHGIYNIGPYGAKLVGQLVQDATVTTRSEARTKLV